MNDTEKLKIALGGPLRKVIGNQEFEFYPLEVTYLPDFFALYGGAEGKSEEEAIKSMAKPENMKVMVNLIVNMVKDSFPKDTDETLIKRFCMKYFVELGNVLTELNKPAEGNQRKVKTIKKLRERVKKAKEKEKPKENVQIT